MHPPRILRSGLVVIQRKGAARKHSVLSWEIWGSHDGKYEDYVPLGCDAVQYGRKLPPFLRNPLLPSSEQRSKPYRKTKITNIGKWGKEMGLLAARWWLWPLKVLGQTSGGGGYVTEHVFRRKEVWSSCSTPPIYWPLFPIARSQSLFRIRSFYLSAHCPEDGDSRFLRNIGNFLPESTASRLRGL
jgi:hypothetical protein